MAKKSDNANGWQEEVVIFFNQIVQEFELDIDALKILEVGCDSLSRLYQAKAILENQGLTYVTESGTIKKHPANEIEKVAKAQFLQAMRMLGISDVEPNRPGRPTTRAGL